MIKSDNDLSSMVKNIADNIPKRVLKDIDAGITECEAHKNGFVWQYQDDGKEFNLMIDKNGIYRKEYASLNLRAISKKELLDMKEYDDEKLLGTFTLYLYKSELKGKVLKVNYNFNVKLVNGNYIVKITTDANTYIKPYEEILEHNGLKEVHRNNIGLRYSVNIKDIVGEERKTNKIII